MIVTNETNLLRGEVSFEQRAIELEEVKRHNEANKGKTKYGTKDVAFTKYAQINISEEAIKLFMSFSENGPSTKIFFYLVGKCDKFNEILIRKNQNLKDIIHKSTGFSDVSISRGLKFLIDIDFIKYVKEHNKIVSVVLNPRIVWKSYGKNAVGGKRHLEKEAYQLSQEQKQLHLQKQEIRNFEHNTVQGNNFNYYKQKQIIDQQWKNYQKISKSYWELYRSVSKDIADYRRNLQQQSKGAEQKLKDSVNKFVNNSHGIISGLFYLIGMCLAFLWERNVRNQMYELQSAYMYLDDIRNEIFEAQSSAKSTLKEVSGNKNQLSEKDLFKLENAISGFADKLIIIEEQLNKNYVLNVSEYELQTKER